MIHIDIYHLIFQFIKKIFLRKLISRSEKYTKLDEVHKKLKNTKTINILCFI